MKRALTAVAGVGVVAACTVQTIFPYGTGPPPGSASQLVGATGGLVVTDDGTTLLIPPGALSGDETITIGLDPATDDPPQGKPLGAGHVIGPAGLSFKRPVCLTLSFEPGLLPQGTAESRVVLYQQVGDAGAYEELPTVAADATHVTATGTQLTTVVVAYGSGEELDASTVNCDANQLDAPEDLAALDEDADADPDASQ